MRIWDCVMLRNELAMLQCRLEETEGAVYKTVVVEADRTHQGHPKPYHLADHWDRFRPWHDQMIYVMTTLPPPQERDDNPWSREHAQRDAARDVLKEYGAAGDIVLLCDIDEIPSRQSLPELERALLSGYPAVTFSQRLFIFAVDWEFPGRQATAVACTMEAALNQPLGDLRDQRDHITQIATGWHFTWLGGEEEMREKLAAHCHTEKDEAISRNIDAGQGLRLGIHFDGQVPLSPVNVDDSWPRYISERRCPPDWFRPREPW